MTDTELSRIKAICETANVKDIGDVSDGYHTFNGLYYQRMILFSALVKAYKDKAWKSHRHEDGELCFGGGWFIIGIDTPEGSFTYHYEDKDWDRFDCQELPVAKHWDGHREENVTRLLSLPNVRPVRRGKWVESKSMMEVVYCSECGFRTIYGAGPDGLGRNYNYCPDCGADMREVLGDE